jgi:hypothetical protein
MRNKKTILQEEDITIGESDYKLITYEDNTQSLKRFNEKTKMWLNVYFVPKEESNPNIEKEIVDILSKSYIERMVNKV